jgi:L-malate glycosyltransferase
MPWPVLLMACELDLGGSERQMTEIAKALDRSRFEPHVGCFRAEGMRGRELAAAGVPIVQFPVRSFVSAGAASGAWDLARYVRRWNIRLVHTFDYPLTTFAVPVARLFTSAAVVSSQRSHRELIPRHYRRLVRITDRLAAAVVVNCEFVQRHLEEDEGVPAGRIRLCYNGIDLEAFQPGAGVRPASLPADAFVIGTVCALRPEKGLTTLVDAFARIRPMRAGLKLVIVGSGSMLAALEAQVELLGLQRDCLFVPATERVPDWLGAMDIFVLPSRTEALSNALLEAMACGCCPVASNVGGNPELVRSGETGLLFESGDFSGLTAALAGLIESTSLRQRLAAAGAQLVRERFSIRASAERMGEIYAQLIEAR